MKVVLVSNFLNHHQIPLAEAFIKKGDEFRFVSTCPGANGGYQKNIETNYVINYYATECKAKEWVMEADIAIFGSASYELLGIRLRYNKLSFIYSERLFKERGIRSLSLKKMLLAYRYFIKYQKKNIFVLCASAYLVNDLERINFPLCKCYKWGYFPESKQYNLKELFIHKKDGKTISILWVGRLIKWKHPEIAVLLAERLRREGYSFRIDIIGDGELKNKLWKMIERKKMHDCVKLLGSMTPEKVRGYMEAANIYLFTSDRNEGWGAVLNESMNSACAVVANKEIGSVPYLLEDGKNGYIYSSLEEMYSKVLKLMNSPVIRERLGKEAYRTIVNMWNADNAIENLIQLAKALMNNSNDPHIISGPCSRCL